MIPLFAFKLRILEKFDPVTLCIRETPKQVLLQTVKTRMKCHILQHFIRVYTVCQGKKDLHTKNTIFNKKL